MKRYLVISLLCIALGACGSNERPAAYPTYTPWPPLPTYTLVPTYTLYPTELPTATAKPTATTLPTATLAPTATSAPKPKIGTRASPIPVGQTATLDIGDGVYVGHVKRVVTGQEAVDMITKANMFNEVPASGFKATLIYFVADYTKGPEDDEGGLSDWHFDFLCGDGKFYQDPAVVEPSPAFGGSGFPGATFEGWLCWFSKVTDKPDLLLWKTSPFGDREGAYFALQ